MFVIGFKRSAFDRQFEEALTINNEFEKKYIGLSRKCLRPDDNPD